MSSQSFFPKLTFNFLEWFPLFWLRRHRQPHIHSNCTFFYCPSRVYCPIGLGIENNRIRVHTMHGFVHFYGWICQIRHVKARNLIGQEALSDCSQFRRAVINLYILLGYVKQRDSLIKQNMKKQQINHHNWKQRYTPNTYYFIYKITQVFKQDSRL